MRKILTISLLAIGALATYAKDIKELVVTTTPQMSCQNCENKIKGNLRFEKGIKKIETDLEKQLVTITYDADKTDESKIEEAFGKLNYQVRKIEECDDATSCKPAGSCCERKRTSCQGNNSCKQEKRNQKPCCPADSTKCAK